MTIPEPIALDPRASDLDKHVERLHAGPGVYVIHMPEAIPHLGSCAYLRARLRRLTGLHGHLQQKIVRIDCWPVASKLESLLILYSLARGLFPREYERKLRLRMPWFVELGISDRFPRVLISNRLPEANESAYGPFPSRDVAQAYAEGVAGLFQIRKCPDPLEPSSDHPGCIYGEMGQCLRPCQCAVSAEEYASEAGRVAEFLRTNGKNARTSLTIARERASAEMDFESAAQIHKRLEKLNSATVLFEDPAGEVETFGGVAVTGTLHAGSVRLWPMKNATWLAPLDVSTAPDPSQSRSLDARLRELVDSALTAAPNNSSEKLAHLALLLRWYRSSWRDGEWIPHVPGKGLSYRKLVGAISKVAKAGANGAPSVVL